MPSGAQITNPSKEVQSAAFLSSPAAFNGKRGLRFVPLDEETLIMAAFTVAAFANGKAPAW